jgi:hypothetical protein
MTKIYDTDKCFCKVESIKGKETLIEFYLPDGEIIRKANPTLINILKRLKLHKQGAEFYTVTTETRDSLITKIEPYVVKDSKKVYDVYYELSKVFKSDEVTK